MEERVRIPLVKQILLFSWSRAFGILAIILMIFASPLVQMQRAVGQLGNETNIEQVADGGTIVIEPYGNTIGQEGTNDEGSKNIQEVAEETVESQVSNSGQISPSLNQDYESEISTSGATQSTISNESSNLEGTASRQHNGKADDLTSYVTIPNATPDADELATNEGVRTFNLSSTSLSPSTYPSLEGLSLTTPGQLPNQTIAKLESPSQRSQSQPPVVNQSTTTAVSISPVNNDSSSITNKVRLTTSITNQSFLNSIFLEHTALNNYSANIVSNDSSTSYSPDSSNESSTIPSNQSTTTNTSSNQSFGSDKSLFSQSAIASDSLATDELSEPTNSVVQTISVGDGQAINLGDVSNSDNAGATISVDKPSYELGDVMVITVIDADANVDPDEVNTVDSTISSGIDQKTITLTETGPNTGIFVGHISLTNEGSSESSIKVNPTTKKIEASYDSFHQRAAFVIDEVVQPGTARLSDLSVTCQALNGPCDSSSNFPIGNPVQLTLEDGGQLAPNEFTSSCGTCGGNITITMSYANTPLPSSPAETFTIFQMVGEFGWINLAEFSTVTVDENAKVITATTPFGPGTFLIIAGPGPGAPAPRPVPGAPGAGIVLGLAVPFSSTRLDVVSKAVLSQQPLSHSDNLTSKLHRLQSVQDVHSAKNISQEGDLVENMTENISTNSSEPVEQGIARIDASTVYKSKLLQLSADVRNLVILINTKTDINVVIAEGSQVFWVKADGIVNLESLKLVLTQKNSNTTELLFTALLDEHKKYTGFLFSKPGLYEYSSPSSPQVKGTIKVVTKTDNAMLASTTPAPTTRTVGYLIAPIEKKEFFDKLFDNGYFHLLSSFSIPSHSNEVPGILYIWGTESIHLQSILSNMDTMS